MPPRKQRIVINTGGGRKSRAGTGFQLGAPAPTIGERVSRAVSRLAEKKQVRRATAVSLKTITATVLPPDNSHVIGLFLSPQIVQGDGMNQRNGNAVKLQAVQIRLEITQTDVLTNPMNGYVRIIIVLGPNSVAANDLAIKDSGGSSILTGTVKCKTDLGNNNRVKYDKVHRINTDDSSVINLKHNLKKFRKKLTFTNNADDFGDSWALSIFAFGVSKDVMAVAPQLQSYANAHYTYTDI